MHVVPSTAISFWITFYDQIISFRTVFITGCFFLIITINPLLIIEIVRKPFSIRENKKFDREDTRSFKKCLTLKKSPFINVHSTSTGT